MISITVKKELFDKRTIFVTMDWYLSKAAVSIDCDDVNWIINIDPKDDSISEEEIRNKLVENEIKTVINRDTYSIREAIYNMKHDRCSTGM